jgi:uncharacterized protein (TIGR02246 family)
MYSPSGRSWALSALLLVATAGGGCSAGTEEALADRVRTIEAEKEIRDLMVSYGQYLDAKDFESYSRLFAREGKWSGLLGEFTTVTGPDSIREAMERAFAGRTYDADHITNIHLISNIKINVDGDDATGYSRWTVMSRDAEDRPRIRLSGRYDDVFIREDGQWKFLSRVASREIP